MYVTFLLKWIIAGFLIGALIGLPSANAYSTQIDFYGFKWQKDWLRILIVGDERHNEIATWAIDDFMYGIKHYTGNYGQWQYMTKAISYEEYTEWIGFFNADIIIYIEDDYWKTGDLGSAYVLNEDNELVGYSSEGLEIADHSNIYVTTKYNSTHYLPENIFYQIVMHEFGHGLGLGHPADENMVKRDPMALGYQMATILKQGLVLDLTCGCWFLEIQDIWFTDEIVEFSILDGTALTTLYSNEGWSSNPDQYSMYKLPELISIQRLG